jgi:hypothetical protein
MFGYYHRKKNRWIRSDMYNGSDEVDMFREVICAGGDPRDVLG